MCSSCLLAKICFVFLFFSFLLLRLPMGIFDSGKVPGRLQRRMNIRSGIVCLFVVVVIRDVFL